MTRSDASEILDTLRTVCTVETATTATHDRGLAVCKRNDCSLLDLLILASALIAGAGVLYSEDLQYGQIIDRQLRVIN